MDSELEQAREGLRFSIQLAVRYHQKRAAVFKRLEIASRAMAAIATAGGVVNFLSTGPQWLYLLVLAILGAFQILDGVVDLRDLQHTASKFAERYTDLEVALMRVALSRESLDSITTTRLELEKEEGATLRVLAVICRNELVLASGFPTSELKQIGPIQRLLSPFVDWRAHLFEKHAMTG